VNDIAMVFFFGLITKEVIEATAPGGVLHSWRKAMLPVIASVAAAAVPALLYGRVVDALDEPMLAFGWPVPMATDLAIGYFVVRLIFGLHPVIPFFLLLGIGCDVLGFLTVAFLNPIGEVNLVLGAAMLAGAIVMALALRRWRVVNFWPYLIGPGVVAWLACFWSGLHPALALMPIMPFLPHAPRDPGFFVDALPNAKDTLSRFENVWRYPVQVTLFFFGLVNAGVPMGALEAGTWGLPIAALLGKPVGVLVGAGLGRLAGFHLPHRVGWPELLVSGLISAMGFSIGLFFCAALLPPGQLRSEVSMGVLLTLAAAPLAFVCAAALRVGRFSPSQR
jgi:NhaA family Na+:H+ antiporter